jgi:hypothetical protein
MTGARGAIQHSAWETAILLLALALSANAQSDLPYTTCASFSQLLEGRSNTPYFPSYSRLRSGS